MTNPQDDHIADLLPAFLNGTLDPGEQARVRAHLERCASCRDELAEWRVIATATRALVDARPAPAAPDIGANLAFDAGGHGSSPNGAAARPPHWRIAAGKGAKHAGNDTDRLAAHTVYPGRSPMVTASAPLPSEDETQHGFLLLPSARLLHLVSTGLLIVAMTALFGVLVARPLGPIDPDDRLPAGNQGLYDPDDLSTYPRVPETCEPNGEGASDAQLAQRSISDWPEPEYTPARPVSHERGLAIQETYLAYLRCQHEAFTSATPDLDVTGTPTIPRSPEMLSYYSDRMRYTLLDGALSAEQQEALEPYRCRPHAEEILASWPLPVNQPEDYAILSLLPHIDDIDELAFTFSPSDVYLLPDGRYGAIIGTISTAALRNPTELTLDDSLTFIAFVEDGDRYLIDEMFLVVGPDRDQPIVDRPEDSPPTNAVRYRPIENETCEPPAE